MADMNNQDIAGNIETIRNALGNPDGCKITYIEATRTYTIAPQEGQKEVRISVVNDIVHDNSTIHLFEVFSFSFQKCVFEIEISLGREIYNVLRFGKCTFNGNVNCINTTFRNFLSFSESTFEQHAFFTTATFDKGTQFLNNTFKGMVDFQNCHFNDETSFSRTIFEQKASFSKTEFNGKANFDNAHFKMETTFSGSNFKEKVQFKETTFENYAHLDNVQFGDETKSTKEKADYDVNFSIIKFNGRADFSKASFQYKTYFQSTIFSDYATFDGAEFVNEANFSRAYFKERVELGSTFGHDANFSEVFFDDDAEFGEAEFLQKAIFYKSQFKKDAFFSNSIFQEADFSQSKFYQKAYFYGTTFQDFPNFIQAIFSGDINFTNTELDFGFEKTRKRIEALYDKKMNEYNSQEKQNKKEPKKYKIANEFRDSFRNIKSALIEHHSMLDASNYHRVELYCKELELEYRREEKEKNSEFFSRNFVDEIQLMCYRLTSDHHTDLLLILNNVIILIALFSTMNFAINYFDIHSFKIEQAINAFIACFMFIILAIFLILGCGKLVISFSTTISYVRAFFHEKQHAKICFRACIVFVSHITTAIILVVKPASLVPIFGKLIDEDFKKGFPVFTSLSIVYAILMFLLVFSLQKTARKNTIVPN